MTWETYKPKLTGRLTEGTAGLAKNGMLTILDSDLAKAQILGTRVVIKMDREGSRLSLQEPTSQTEPTLALCVASKGAAPSSRVHIRRVIDEMGMVIPEAMRCRIATTPTQLIVMLTLEPAKVRAKPLERKP